MFLTLPKGAFPVPSNLFVSFSTSTASSHSGLISSWVLFDLVEEIFITMTYMRMPIPMPEDGVFAFVLVVKVLDSLISLQEEKEGSLQLLNIPSWMRPEFSESPGNLFLQIWPILLAYRQPVL